MLGSIIGDVVGSVYEFNNFKFTDFPPFFHPDAHFTDDTILVVAIADALLNQRDPAASLKDWGRRYLDQCNWGCRYHDWLESDSMTGYHSYGNGAAARVAPVGLLARSMDEVHRLAHHVTVCTHDHPEGLKGAAATASAIFLAKDGASKDQIRSYITSTFGYDLSRTTDQIRPTYEYSESCQKCVPEAITCALEGMCYESSIRLAVSLGGDSDTIACITGGIAEMLYGIPDDIAARGSSFLPGEMLTIMQQLYAKSSSSASEQLNGVPLTVARP